MKKLLGVMFGVIVFSTYSSEERMATWVKIDSDDITGEVRLYIGDGSPDQLSIEKELNRAIECRSISPLLGLDGEDSISTAPLLSDQSGQLENAEFKQNARQLQGSPELCIACCASLWDLLKKHMAPQKKKGKTA